MLPQPLSAQLLLSSQPDREGEGRNGGDGGGGEEGSSRKAEEGSPQPENWGYSRSVPSSPQLRVSGFKIAVVSFVQHEKEPQKSAA